jgi:transcriptional regulator with XRE-family HTH domain
LRTEKGFSRQEMADRLHIDLSAYTRLENGKTYSWAKYLEDLLAVFEISIESFFEGLNASLTIKNKNGSFGSNTLNIEHLHAENKEANEKLINTLKEEIAFLRKLLEKEE